MTWTMAAVDGFALLAGSGPPDEGDTLDNGALQFTGVCERLRSAVADDDWSGDASQSHSGREATLRELALSLADLDTQLGSLISDHAGRVIHVRWGFGVLEDLLAGALVIELALRYSGSVSAAMKFAIGVCALGIIDAIAMLSALAYFSTQHAGNTDLMTTRDVEAATAGSPGV